MPFVPRFTITVPSPVEEFPLRYRPLAPPEYSEIPFDRMICLYFSLILHSFKFLYFHVSPSLRTGCVFCSDHPVWSATALGALFDLTSGLIGYCTGCTFWSALRLDRLLHWVHFLIRPPAWSATAPGALFDPSSGLIGYCTVCVLYMFILKK